MNTKIQDLMKQINSLQEEVEREYRHAREEFVTRKVLLAENFLAQQRRHKIGILRFILQSRILVILKETTTIIPNSLITEMVRHTGRALPDFVSNMVKRRILPNKAAHFSVYEEKSSLNF
ncbi:MAG: hypothetical protein A2622_01525 [Bdellovibrionales bacterium RIFCSPHIGHO2_01_FULL_40_29]|nr:MAG: hypothetical protein A2622_01525 [Bdellovibrionales bacterium RIFCSPHIGHO2_01_FULL_40_29]OFZ33777.1 MAG: hypothetical protein A3D17_01945 [Bdellovibrionales bacterium RIFCSPHIGHO2_02_FULL_40_15]